MTAFATKLADESWARTLRGIRLPSRYKLAGEYVLGVSQAESIKNRADPTKPLTVQGVPTYNADHVVVRSSAAAGYGFKTGIIAADDTTIIVVRKNAALATHPHVVGFGTASGPKIGMRQFDGPTRNFFGNGEATDNLGANRATPASGAEIYFEAGVMSKRNPQRVLGGLGKLYWYSGGVQQVATSADVGGVLDRASLLGGAQFTEVCIGSNSLSDIVDTNTIPVYFVAVYLRPLTAAEIGAAYAAIVAYYAARGVTVV